MLAFASAVLLFAASPALCAPLASSPLIDYAPVNTTHQQLVRTPCPEINSVKISYKSANSRKPWSTKTILILGDATLERDRCVYPIQSGWPGMASGAASVTPLGGQMQDFQSLSRYANIISQAGDLLQRDAFGPNNQPWVIVNRSGSYLKDTKLWKKIMLKYPGPTRATITQAIPCDNMFDLLYSKLADQIRAYGSQQLIHAELNFDRILLNDDWSNIRFIDWPQSAVLAETSPLTEHEIHEIVSSLDIQPRDGYFVDENSQKTAVTGTCQSGPTRAQVGFDDEDEWSESDSEGN